MRTRRLRLAAMLVSLVAGFLAGSLAGQAPAGADPSYREPVGTPMDPCTNTDPLNCTWNGTP